MTPNRSTVYDAPQAHADQAASRLRMPAYPRIADVLSQLRPEAAAPATTAASVDAPVAPQVAHAAVAQAIAADELTLVPGAAPAAPRPAHGAPETLSVVAAPSFAATLVEPQPEPELTDEELDELLAELSLRELLREAVRARLVAAATGARQRSAYELVFLMLAFSVMVLITAPPLVQLALALHGTPPS